MLEKNHIKVGFSVCIGRLLRSLQQFQQSFGLLVRHLLTRNCDTTQKCVEAEAEEQYIVEKVLK
jgi:hypothetical protein